VWYTGELTGAYLSRIRGVGLFVLQVEGLPMAMLEAMLEGVPVLTDIPVHQQLTAGGNLPHAVEIRDTGMLFQVGIWTPARCLDWAIHHPQAGDG